LYPALPSSSGRLAGYALTAPLPERDVALQGGHLQIDGVGRLRVGAVGLLLGGLRRTRPRPQNGGRAAVEGELAEFLETRVLCCSRSPRGRWLAGLRGAHRAGWGRCRCFNPAGRLRDGGGLDLSQPGPPR
jgi:hypothetical protein